MRPDTLQSIADAGESDTVEFKKSTAQLTRAGETLCAFLNTDGGRVFVGITPEGRILGQTFADATLREVATMLSQLEPAAPVSQERVALANGKEVLVLVAPALAGQGPFTFQGRPYQRIGPTTSVLPRRRYEERILQNVHPRHRWETMDAYRAGIDDLDANEILRTVRLGIEAGRLPEATGTDIPEILDRLELRSDGALLNAAVVLFGARTSLHYPQCSLRLARFRGTDKSEFLDNRQHHGHAFHLLDEAMAFLHRHLPISGRFEENRLERIEELLVPVPALRETIVNALCHRDYAHPGGAVSVAVFDDRVEIWSDGPLPFGLTPEDLRGVHA